MSVAVCDCEHMNKSVCEVEKKITDMPKVWAVMICPVWVLGTTLGFSSTTVYALNH